MTDDALIADLIKENRYATIKDYLEIRDEIKAINNSFDKTTNNEKNITHSRKDG